MKTKIIITESQLQKIVKKRIMELFRDKDEYLKYLEKHDSPFNIKSDISKENLEDYIGRIFIPKVYIKDIFTDEPIGKGNHYKLRKVFDYYASFDDLDDRSSDSYKYNKQPIIKIHIDDVIEKMKLKKEENFDDEII